jgi:hypothetical protein
MDEPTGSVGGGWPSIAGSEVSTADEGEYAPIYAKSSATANELRTLNSSCIIADGN